MTTGKWTQPGVPHKGWLCVDIEDLGEPDAVCEMCEVIVIRYVHYMTHEDYPETLGCGCICAGHMEEDLIGARARETAFKNSRARRKRWLFRKWRHSWHKTDHQYLNVDGFHVGIYPRRGNIWGARVLSHNDPLPAPPVRLQAAELFARSFEAA
jgi:hypothetical protein